MTVDGSNNTILYSRDRLDTSITSPASLGTIEGIGLVISMLVIDVGVLQPTYHSKYYSIVINLLKWDCEQHNFFNLII